MLASGGARRGGPGLSVRALSKFGPREHPAKRQGDQRPAYVPVARVSARDEVGVAAAEGGPPRPAAFTRSAADPIEAADFETAA